MNGNFYGNPGKFEGKKMTSKRHNGRHWVQFSAVFISFGISKIADFLLYTHPFLHRSKFLSRFKQFLWVLSKIE